MSGVPAALRPALIIGKVPLFFYVLHFFLIHLLAVAASFLRYGRVGEMFRSPDLAHFPFSAPPGWGASLPVDLCGLGHCTINHVSALPLVCRRQKAEQRLVARLSVTRV